jgi:hypothetical protein
VRMTTLMVATMGHGNTLAGLESGATANSASAMT